MSAVTELVTYTRHENGIMEFVFHESSHRALDQWFEYIEADWQNLTPGTVHLVLIDTLECGTQPLGYALQRARELTRKYPHYPAYRTAFIERNTMMAKIIDALLKTLFRTINVRYYTAGERDEALKWLLSDKA